MPYLNPETVPSADDAEFCSVCVCFPDYPEYRAALLGSLNYLAQWTAWERDSAHSARKSAALWLVANEATKECWDMPCGGSTLPPVINVTVNNSCGGGSSSTAYCVNDDGTITINPPPIGEQPVFPVLPLPDGLTEIPDPFTPDEGTPPTGYDDWETYDADACAAANALVEYAYQFFYEAGKFLTEDVFSMGAMLIVIINILTSPLGLYVLFERALSLRIVELVGRYWWVELLGAPFVAVAEYIDENRQEMVCELYQARGNSASWENLVIARIFTLVTGMFYTTDGEGYFKEMVTSMLPGGIALRLIYMNGSFVNPNALDCSICEDEEPSGLWAKDYTPTGGTFVHSYDGVTFQQIQYTHGIGIVFGEQWYMRSGIFYVSTTSDLNDTPADAVIRVTNMEQTSVVVSVENAAGTLIDSQTLAGGASHDYAGCYLMFTPTTEYTDMVRVSVLSRILE